MQLLRAREKRALQRGADRAGSRHLLHVRRGTAVAEAPCVQLVSSPVRPPTSDARVCAHCGFSLARAATTDFCCAGCEAVWSFLRDEGLERYYDLRGPEGVPALAAGASAAERADRKWLEPIAADLAARTHTARVAFDVQGMHCSACVWLTDQVFHRQGGAVGIVVNPAIGRADLTVEPSFDLSAFVATIEGLGYRVGPPLRNDARVSRDLVWRMGVCLAIAMNTMIFGFAVYCGLAEGPVFRLFAALGFGLSFVSVLVGGSVFFRSALAALRRRTLHLDLPIALGIALAFGSSTLAYLRGMEGASYFDTLNVFIALMLVGRFLQERVLLRNRADILESSGAEHVLARRLLDEGRTELVPCRDIRPGDRLLVARADLVPVDARTQDRGEFSLDWINGESAPRSFGAGDLVPAGAFSANDGAVVVEAASSFEASALASLLRTTTAREADVARATPFWQRLARLYVGAVLALAVLAFGGWVLATGDVSRALTVVTGLLIVTCPCAFGIATPLAYELVQAGLRRAGLFVRSPSFLDRATAVRTVVFDKTGTLTTGVLTLTDERDLDALDAHEQSLVYAMTAQSGHPKSRALARALERRGLRFAALLPSIVEVPGHGIELRRGSHVYRLGAPAWASGAGTAPRWLSRRGTSRDADLLLTVDGEERASFGTKEQLRPDAIAELRSLAELGLRTAVLSGDTTARTQVIAEACGIPGERTFGDATPSDKARILRSLDHGDALFIGDGINDALACEVATCAGTPAIDRPFMAARSDFYVVTAGLRPLRLALVASRRLSRVVGTNLVIAIAYNVVTVGLALAGLMSPLACAVLMPLSSVSTVLATTLLLGRRSALWRS